MTDYDKIWVRVKHATKKFATRKGEVTALEDVNLEIHDGQFVCLLGPSGCGKTTLLRMIGGLDVPTSGTITIDGKVVDGPSPKMTMVFQEYSLYPWRTVAENVGFGLEMNGVPAEERREEVMKELRLVGLENFADSYPYELSGGMRQRAAVARALATDPAVMLMDEPFGALDAQTRVNMQEQLAEISRKTNSTVLFITHDIDEAILLGNRILVMTKRPGKIRKEIAVNLNCERNHTALIAPEFLTIKKEIMELLWEQQTI